MSDAAGLDAHAHWTAKSEASTSLIDIGPLRRLAATLDHDDVAAWRPDEVPPLWHWLYFLPQVATRDLGGDGHARRGDFLPPITLPRRMWAGGRLVFHAPLRVGAVARRVSRVESVSRKSGRSGELVFVLVRHEIHSDGVLALVEEQDLVYRAALESPLQARAAPAAPLDETSSRTLVAHDALLFRYSALTFNTHRIHYDRRYCEREEGYPGLVVHGPLIATLLAEQLRSERPGARLQQFEFRAVSPIFDAAPFEVCARFEDGLAALWARDAHGRLAMQAEARFAPGAAP
jgi:3-methylfumaryl-CoA hydratase